MPTRPLLSTPGEEYAAELAVASQMIIAAVHDEGPDALRETVDKALAIEAPAGTDPVYALFSVLAAQVNPDSSLDERFGWTTEGLDGIHSRPEPDLNATRAAFGLPTLRHKPAAPKPVRGTPFSELDDSDRRDIETVACGYRPVRALPRNLRPTALARAVDLGYSVVGAGRMLGVTDATAREYARAMGIPVGYEQNDATVDDVLAGRRPFAELPGTEERHEAVRECILAGLTTAVMVEKLQAAESTINRYASEVRRAAIAAGEPLPASARTAPKCLPAEGPSAALVAA